MTPPALMEPPVRSELPLDGRGGPTLDEIIVDAWEGLAGDRTAPCPVCHGTLVPRYGAGSGPVGGRCRDCDSEIS